MAIELNVTCSSGRFSLTWQKKINLERNNINLSQKLDWPSWRHHSKRERPSLIQISFLFNCISCLSPHYLFFFLYHPLLFFFFFFVSTFFIICICLCLCASSQKWAQMLVLQDAISLNGSLAVTRYLCLSLIFLCFTLLCFSLWMVW